MKTLLLAFMILSSCAAKPAFHKIDGTTGYLVKESAIKEVLEVHVELPPGTDEKFVDDYLLRASGEECLARGFPYFDFGYQTNTTVKVICYPTESKITLGVGIDPKVALSKTPKLQILEPADGMPAPFKSHDIILKVGGKKVRTIGELKERVYAASREKGGSVSLLVDRSGIPIVVEAPLEERDDSLVTPDILKALRSKAP